MENNDKKESVKIDYKIIETMSKINELKKITEECIMTSKIQYNSITRG